VLSGSFEAPRDGKENGFQRALRGYELSYIFTYASRLPFNVVTGSDRNLDTNNNDRPVAWGETPGTALILHR